MVRVNGHVLKEHIPTTSTTGTVVATLLTPIGSQFKASNQASYIGTSYLLSVCCFTPLYGTRTHYVFTLQPQLLIQDGWLTFLVEKVRCYLPYPYLVCSESLFGREHDVILWSQDLAPYCAASLLRWAL